MSFFQEVDYFANQTGFIIPRWQLAIAFMLGKAAKWIAVGYLFHLGWSLR